MKKMMTLLVAALSVIVLPMAMTSCRERGCRTGTMRDGTKIVECR